MLSAEEDLPDPMTGLHPPKVAATLVPVFTGTELARLQDACAGRGFAQRRDAAMIAVLQATGIRLAELAGICYDPHDPRRSDIDLWQREITVHGKGGRPRIVKISHDTAGPWTATCVPAPATRRPGGLSCGSAGAAGDR